MITLLDKHGKEIQEQDKIMERIEEFYSELYYSDQRRDETIAKQLAKLYTKCITERRIPKTWKEANMVIFFQEREQKRHQELQTNLLAIKYVQTVHKNNNN